MHTLYMYTYITLHNNRENKMKDDYLRQVQGFGVTAPIWAGSRGNI